MSGARIQKLVAINISVKCNNFFRVLQWLYLFLDGTSHLDLPPAIPILFANSEKSKIEYTSSALYCAEEDIGMMIILQTKIIINPID